MAVQESMTTQRGGRRPLLLQLLQGSSLSTSRKVQWLS